MMFVTSGLGDEHQAAEWIHKAYRFRQRSRSRNPLLGLVVPLERMLQAPDAFLPAFEPLLDNEDPWVRALTRLHLGKMRIVLGQGGRDASRRCHPHAIATGPAVLAARRQGLQRGGHGRGAEVRRTGHLAGRAGRAGSREGGTRAVERRRRCGAPPPPRRDPRPARLPRRRARRGAGAPRCGLPSGDRSRAPVDDRDGARRGRGPGAAVRPARAGRAVARGERRRPGVAGSRASRRGPDRADRTREGAQTNWSHLATATLAS
jgi:hypothetical protein